MSRCGFDNSQLSAQDTLGVAGDDIMFHILVFINIISDILWNTEQPFPLDPDFERNRP